MVIENKHKEEIRTKVDGKICSKASRKDNKINKSQLEDWLVDSEVMGDQKKTRRAAKKMHYEKACEELINAENPPLEKVVISDSKTKEDEDCLKKTHKNIRVLAKKYNLTTSGSKQYLCNELKKIGYIFNDNNEILESPKKCYKLRKSECESDKTPDCDWLPQIAKGSKLKGFKESKKGYIARLKVLEKLNGTKKNDKYYEDLSLDEIKKILSKYGIKQMGAFCIEKNKANLTMKPLQSMQKNIKKYLSESSDTKNIQDTNLETLEETNNTVDALNIESQNIIADTELEEPKPDPLVEEEYEIEEDDEEKSEDINEKTTIDSLTSDEVIYKLDTDINEETSSFENIGKELVEEVQDEEVQNEDIQNEMIQNEMIQSEMVQDEMVQDEMVQDEMVQDEMVQGEMVQGEMVQDEEKIQENDKNIYNIIPELTKYDISQDFVQNIMNSDDSFYEDLLV